MMWISNLYVSVMQFQKEQGIYGFTSKKCVFIDDFQAWFVFKLCYACKSFTCFQLLALCEMRNIFTEHDVYITHVTYITVR